MQKPTLFQTSIMQTNQKFMIPLKEPISLLDYAYLLIKTRKFCAPEQFQRPLAWQTKDNKSFFQSVLMNRAEGTFVLVDIQQCIERMEYDGDTSSDTYRFFKKYFNEGFKYFVLDGNNRLCFISSLLEDNYLIPEGTYEFISDEVNGNISSFTVRKGKQKFSDLPTRVQRVIQSRKAVLSVYTQITLEGMSEVFQNVNSGVPLNAQELRNAYSSPWAEFFRDLSKEVAPLLSYTHKDPIFRLKGQEWLLDCIAMVIDGIAVNEATGELQFTSITQSSKNKLYKSTFFTEEEQNFYTNKFIELMDFISQMLHDEILEEKSLKQKAKIQNLYWMMTTVDGIETYDQAVAAVEKQEIAYLDKQRKFGEEDKTFRQCCEGMNAENLEVRYTILTEILTEVVGERNDFSTLNEVFESV
jgi:hypothetical protein